MSLKSEIEPLIEARESEKRRSIHVYASGRRLFGGLSTSRSFSSHLSLLSLPFYPITTSSASSSLSALSPRSLCSLSSLSALSPLSLSLASLFSRNIIIVVVNLLPPLTPLPQMKKSPPLSKKKKKQLSACLNSMRTDPDRYSPSYPCSYASWRSGAVSPRRQPLVIAGSGSSILSAAARAHSTEMASRNFFSHNSADGTSPSARITGKFGYPSGYVGENIAAGQQTVLSVCAAWMCSSGHRTNILRCGFDTLGSGVAVNAAASKYGIYWTHDFGCSKGGGGCDSCGASPPQPPSPAPTPSPAPAATPLPTQAPLPPPPSTTAPPATTKPPAPPPPPSPPPPPPPPPPPAGSPVNKFSGSTNSPGDGTWWRPIAAGSALAGPIGQNVRFQALKFSPSATGDYGLVVSAGPSATSAYAGEPWVSLNLPLNFSREREERERVEGKKKEKS